MERLLQRRVGSLGMDNAPTLAGFDSFIGFVDYLEQHEEQYRPKCRSR